MDPIGPNKTPVSSSSGVSSSRASPTTATTGFRGRNVSTAGPPQSTHFLPSSDVQRHSPFSLSPQKVGLAKRFHIAKDTETSKSEYAKFRHDYGADERPPMPRRASDSSYSKLEGEYAKFRHDYGADERPPMPRRASDSSYSKLEGEYAKFRHDYGADERPPMPRRASDSSYELLEHGQEKTSEDTSQSAVQTKSSRRGSEEYDYPYTDIRPKPRSRESEYSKLQHEYGKSDLRAPKLPEQLAKLKRPSVDEQLGMISENSKSQSAEYDDTEIHAKPEQHDKADIKPRMPTPPPPPRPPKSAKESKHIPIPPPIPDRTYKYSQAVTAYDDTEIQAKPEQQDKVDIKPRMPTPPPPPRPSKN